MSKTESGAFRCDVSDLDTHSLIWLNGRLPDNLAARRPGLPWQVYREGYRSPAAPYPRNSMVLAAHTAIRSP